MAIPTIIAFLINAIYALADTYFVSSLGTNATAAVSVNSALDQIIMMTGSMLALGANSYVARLLGARQKEKADQVLSTAFFLAASLGAVLLVFGTVFMTPWFVCWVLLPPVNTPLITSLMSCWPLPSCPLALS